MSISVGKNSSRRQSSMSATSRESAVSRASSGVAPAVTGEKRESTFGDMQVKDAETLMIILDYMRLRCLDAKFYWKPANIDLPVKDTPLIIASRRLCQEYEDAVRRKFGDMYVGSVHVDSLQAKAKFNEVLDEAFQDGKYSWGRIAGVLVFGSQLAIQAFTISKPEYVKEVAKWVYDYLQSEPIQKFILECGGWDALVKEFARKPSVIRDLFGEPHTLLTTVVVTLAAGIFGSLVIHNVMGPAHTCSTGGVKST